jgi:hypothetical protein
MRTPVSYKCADSELWTYMTTMYDSPTLETGVSRSDRVPIGGRHAYATGSMSSPGPHDDPRTRKLGVLAFGRSVLQPLRTGQAITLGT